MGPLYRKRWGGTCETTWKWKIVSAENGRLQTLIRERGEDRDTGYFHIIDETAIAPLI